MAKENTETNASSLTILSKGTTMEGVLISNGNIRLDGHFKGKINVNGNVVIGKEGYAIADIKAHSITIAGKVKGNMDIAEQAIIENQAIILGDIVTKLITIKEGAVFHGKSKIKNIEKLQKELNEGNDTNE